METHRGQAYASRVEDLDQQGERTRLLARTQDLIARTVQLQSASFSQEDRDRHAKDLELHRQELDAYRARFLTGAVSAERG